jgi:hypothetical protein
MQIGMRRFAPAHFFIAQFLGDLVIVSAHADGFALQGTAMQHYRLVDHRNMNLCKHQVDMEVEEWLRLYFLSGANEHVRTRYRT